MYRTCSSSPFSHGSPLRAFCSRYCYSIPCSTGNIPIRGAISAFPSRPLWCCLSNCYESRHLRRCQCCRWSGASCSPILWVCSRHCECENHCLNILLATLALITHIGSLEYEKPTNRYFFVLILLVCVCQSIILSILVHPLSAVHISDTVLLISPILPCELLLLFFVFLYIVTTTSDHTTMLILLIK